VTTGSGRLALGRAGRSVSDGACPSRASPFVAASVDRHEGDYWICPTGPLSVVESKALASGLFAHVDGETGSMRVNPVQEDE
jgi:hypothetical protein